MNAGEKFELDLGADLAQSAATALPFSFVGDVVERGASQTIAAPSAPRLKSSTGFPSHTKRTVASRFKQRDYSDIASSVQSAARQDDSSGQSEDPLLAEKQQIDKENRDRLAAMSTAEIEEARLELLGQLDPALLQSFLRRADITTGSNETADIHAPGRPNTKLEEVAVRPGKRVTFDDGSEDEIDDQKAANQHDLTHDSIHFPQPQQPPDLDPSSETFLDDLHSKYFPSLPAEPDKLEWMRGVKNTKNSYDPSSSTFNPRDIRFDFRGALLAPTTAAQIPVSAGLHHHADAPNAAGYTIPELAHLSRSTYAPQRCIAFQTLGRILYKLGKGDFGDPGEPGANTVGAEDTMGELARGLWREIEVQHVIEHLVAESEGNGVDGGKHVSAKAYATEAVWLWRKGGGRRWKAD